METTMMANSLAFINFTAHSIEIDDHINKPTTSTINHKEDMSKQERKQLFQTARFYTVRNKAIQENFAYIDGEPTQYTYVENDCGTNKDIILVLFGNEKESDLKNLFTKFQSRLHTVIYNQNNFPHKNFIENISYSLKTESMKQAVSEAYRIAGEGQTILFPCTDADFDFFEHIYFS